MPKIILLPCIIICSIAVNAQWSLTGNTGTTPGTNFIGTTDVKDLIFKRSNIQSGLIGSSNTSFGLSALNVTTTGTQNAAFGLNSLFSITTGTNNAAYGQSSLYTNTSGSSNVAIGAGALYANTTGTNLVASGYQALYYNTTGVSNTASGYRALFSNTSGNSNTGTGFGTLLLNTTGGSNTATGVNALYANATGNFNTGSGVTALFSNTSGAQNTATGAQALYSNTTGSYNSAYGLNSLYSNTIGNFNYAGGHHSLYALSTGSNNTATGAYAGLNILSGNNNTIVGANTGFGISTGSGNTIIGANVQSLLPALTNSIILADGTGAVRVFVDNAGHTGIGTSTPNSNAKLDVNGNIYCNQKIYVGAVDGNTLSQIANYALAVNGTAIFNKAKVQLYSVNGGWPDYVFNINYDLLALPDLETYIQKNKHLPNVPVASEIEKDGIDLGDTQAILLKKIEELTLYIIDLNKKVMQQQNEINVLKQK